MSPRRRRPKRERVRLQFTQRNMPGISSEFAQEIVRYRRAIRQALAELSADRPDVAAETLQDALTEDWGWLD